MILPPSTAASLLDGITDNVAVGLMALPGGGAASEETSIVLGHFPDYINLAEKMGADYFQVDPALWSNMSDEERWGLNQQFLDNGISKGAK